MDDVFQYIKDNNGIDIELFYFYEVKVVFMKKIFYIILGKGFLRDYMQGLVSVFLV